MSHKKEPGQLHAHLFATAAKEPGQCNKMPKKSGQYAQTRAGLVAILNKNENPTFL